MKLSTPLLISFAGAACSLTANAAVILPVAWKQSNAFNALRLSSNLSNANGMNPGETILFNLDGSPSGQPTTADNVEWLTSAKVTAGSSIAAEVAAGKAWVIFDLGASYDLTSIQIWNFNWDNTPGTPLTHLNNRGVSQFDILLRNTDADTSDGTPGGSAINGSTVSDAAGALSAAAPFSLGSSDLWTLTLSNQALAQAPNDDTYLGQSFSLSGNTGRFVAIRADTYYGAAGGVGLGKVRLEGTLAIPEPSAALLGSFGLLALLRRRR